MAPLDGKTAIKDRGGTAFYAKAESVFRKTRRNLDFLERSLAKRSRKTRPQTGWK
jgi:hypothetical protein